MAHRSFLAVAFAGVGLLSCGAGDTATGTNPVLDQSPSPNPNQPVNGGQRPSTNPDQPAPNPNGPAVGASGVCSRLCNDLVDCLGLRGQPGVDEGLAECTSECSSDLEASGCAGAYAAFLNCIGSDFICQIVQEEAEEIDVGRAQACVAQAQAVQACTGSSGPDQPEPPDTECTPPSSCNCGGDLCLQCLCVNNSDITLCTETCPDI